jgi:hypothetical protein
MHQNLCCYSISPMLLLLLLPQLSPRTDFFLFGAASSASPFSRFSASPRRRSLSTPRLQQQAGAGQVQNTGTPCDTGMS